MQTVPLHGQAPAGRVALVDDEDYELVRAYRWYIKEVARGDRVRIQSYAAANTWREGRRTRIMMHRLITGYLLVDHINHNGLDNRRANLRPATASQNGANARPRAGGTSQFKGVCWRPRYGKWQARIGRAGRNLGSFATEEEAARAYDAAARELWGEFARLNFPPEEAP